MREQLGLSIRLIRQYEAKPDCQHNHLTYHGELSGGGFAAYVCSECHSMLPFRFKKPLTISKKVRRH